MPTRTNKYGEIDGGTVCPSCGKGLEKKWVSCPHCGETLQSGSVAAGNRKTRGKTTTKPIPTKFVCPGCGEKATAKEGGQFCDQCQAFVHEDCADAGQCPLCHGYI